ncbi:hypothetical protein, partial [Hespellia stercorisuis]
SVQDTIQSYRKILFYSIVMKQYKIVLRLLSQRYKPAIPKGIALEGMEKQCYTMWLDEEKEDCS